MFNKKNYLLAILAACLYNGALAERALLLCNGGIEFNKKENMYYIGPGSHSPYNVMLTDDNKLEFRSSYEHGIYSHNTSLGNINSIKVRKAENEKYSLFFISGDFPPAGPKQEWNLTLTHSNPKVKLPNIPQAGNSWELYELGKLHMGSLMDETILCSVVRNELTTEQISKLENNYKVEIVGPSKQVMED